MYIIRISGANVLLRIWNLSNLAAIGWHSRRCIGVEGLGDYAPLQRPSDPNCGPPGLPIRQG